MTKIWMELTEINIWLQYTNCNLGTYMSRQIHRGKKVCQNMLNCSNKIQPNFAWLFPYSYHSLGSIDWCSASLILKPNIALCWFALMLFYGCVYTLRISCDHYASCVSYKVSLIALFVHWKLLSDTANLLIFYSTPIY